MAGTSWLVGVDTGGTFTDVVAINARGHRKVAKVPSTPPMFEEGIIEGIRRLGIPADEVSLVFHGTTVTTNAALTKSGATTGLLTTKGFRDVLEIRRAHRQDLYDVLWDPPPPLIPRYRRLEIDERTNYAGTVLKGVDPHEVRDAARLFKKRGVEAIAVCFLHSYANPSNELDAKALLQEELPDAYICSSADLLPEPPEFERTSTTATNAYLGPVLSNYLRRLETGLREDGYSADILLMHSAGGVMTLDTSARRPAWTVGSGPAAGVMGAAAVGRAVKRQNLISMDMGGTSCDVSVIVGGSPHLSMKHDLEWGLPIGFPSVDFVAIGAGGGSVAWIDSAGCPKSGPESAGATPGPVCFAKGGDQPTTTDANLVLKRLNPDYFLGGELDVDLGAAERALKSQVAEPLGVDAEVAAAGIVRIANANMASAVRLVTIQKGFDPRKFSLVVFGGAGPLHGVEVARELGIPEVIVPPEPGLTSALGLLFVDLNHHLSSAFVMRPGEGRLGEAEALFREFERELRHRLVKEGASAEAMTLTRFADMRYVGQLHTITVPLAPGTVTSASLTAAIETFHRAHEREYRYSREEWPVEISVLRVEGRADLPKPRLEPAVAPAERTEQVRDVFFEELGWIETRIVERTTVGGGLIEGPAIVEEFNSTTLIPPDAVAEIDGMRNLVIKTG